MPDYLIPFIGLTRRELLRNLRRKYTPLLLAFLIGVPAAAIVSFWPDDQSSSNTIYRFASLVPQITVLGSFAVAVLLLPGYAATSFRTERDRDTLTLLLMTHLTPTSLLLGHIANIVGIFLLFIAAALPSASTIYFLIGLDWQTLPLQYLVLFTTALTCAIAGIASSVYARTAATAIIGAYLLAALLLGGYAALFGVLLAVSTEFIDVPLSVMNLAPQMARFTPPAALLYSSGTAVIFGAGAGPLTSLAITALIQISIILLVMPVVLKGIRKMTPDARVEPITFGTKLTKQRGAFPPIRDRSNPVRVRELRVIFTTFHISKARVLALFAITVVAFLAIAGLAGVYGLMYSDDERLGIIAYWVAGIVFVVALVAPGASTPLWVRERDLDTREQLLMTLLAPRDIIFGKAVAASAFTLAIAGTAALAASPALVMLYNTPGSWRMFGAGLLAIPVVALTLVAVGSQAALHRVSSPMAVIRGYLLGVGYLALPLFFASVPFEMSMKPPSSYILASAILGFSPLGSWWSVSAPIEGELTMVQAAGIPVAAYVAFALFVQCAAIYAFLRDSIRVEGNIIHKGEKP